MVAAMSCSSVNGVFTLGEFVDLSSSIYTLLEPKQVDTRIAISLLQQTSSSGHGAAEIESFLTHLVVERNAAPSTQNQVLHAILFQYREVLEQMFLSVSMPCAHRNGVACQRS